MKNRVSILDCTLRDGGYINDWRFGEEGAKDIFDTLNKVGVDYVEVGFLKNEVTIPGRMVFEHIEEASRFFPPKKSKRAIIVKFGEDYISSQIPERSETSIDFIRVMVWKRLLKEGVEFCKDLVDKGYEVGIQAVRTDDYSDDDYKYFAELYDPIHPTALYIVDSFGVLNKERVLRYAEIADEFLSPDVKIGYHAHNNLQLAMSNSIAFLEREWKHPIMLDASIMGMGLGCGNLPLELISKYLTENGLKDMNTLPTIPIIDKYISGFYEQNPWGYSIPYMLSSSYNCNPRYVKYLQKKGLNYSQIAAVFQMMKANGTGIRMNYEICDSYIEQVKN